MMELTRNDTFLAFMLQCLYTHKYKKYSNENYPLNLDLQGPSLIEV